MTRRPVPELRELAEKMPGRGRLVAHDMVDEIEELRGRLTTVQTGYLQTRREHDELTALHRAEISHFPPKKENT